MSDLGRKNFSDKVEEKLTPESQKSTLDKGKEAVTDTVDKAGRKITPEEDKSFGQKVADNFAQGKEDAKSQAEKDSKALEGEGQTLAETAQEYYDTAKDKLSEAADYVSKSVGGAVEGSKSATEDAAGSAKK
ncbi:uncharacterized protein LODBEIA_P55060 [Lodderomyces beijingensis]|uniref:Uncharacterized protein n=1 Tax=Lodderomyces beijingensis TaxID=1775926 RepID=A0ABP0ZWB5_9ASCO